MPKILKIKQCPTCNNELGIVNVRYASKKHTVRRLDNLYYCEKCKKMLKLKEVFEELQNG